MDPTQWNAPYAVVVFALFCIVFARANGTYWLGRLLLAGGRHTRMKQFLNSPGYARAERWLGTWGAPAVAVSFLTIGIQTMVNLAAGVGRMPQRAYLPAVTAGCVAWAFIYGTVGFVGFEALAKLWAHSPALALTLGGLVVAIVTGVIVRSRKLRQTPTATAH